MARTGAGQGSPPNIADLEGAGLRGLDPGDSTPQGAGLAGALLLGDRFTDPNPGQAPTTGWLRSFRARRYNAPIVWTQNTTDVNFSNAYYMDLNSGWLQLLQLSGGSREFSGHTPSPADASTGLPSGCNGSTIDINWILQ